MIISDLNYLECATDSDISGGRKRYSKPEAKSEAYAEGGFAAIAGFGYNSNTAKTVSTAYYTAGYANSTQKVAGFGIIASGYAYSESKVG